MGPNSRARQGRILAQVSRELAVQQEAVKRIQMRVYGPLLKHSVSSPVGYIPVLSLFHHITSFTLRICYILD